MWRNRTKKREDDLCGAILGLNKGRTICLAQIDKQGEDDTHVWRKQSKQGEHDLCSANRLTIYVAQTD